MYQVKCPPATLASHLSTAALPPIQLHATAYGKETDGPSAWASATHTEDPEEAPGWFQFGSALVVTAI